MSLINPLQNMTPGQAAYEVGRLTKEASPALSYGLAGRLYVSGTGWGLLSVPNALVRGAFDALDEQGVEPPPGRVGGGLDAHISVFSASDIEEIGGPDKLTERGHTFRYTLGPVKCVRPDGWEGISKVWMIEVNSPELKKLRKSYGLTASPKDNRHKFHITIGVRRTNVFKERAGT